MVAIISWMNRFVLNVYVQTYSLSGVSNGHH